MTQVLRLAMISRSTAHSRLSLNRRHLPLGCSPRAESSGTNADAWLGCFVCIAHKDWTGEPKVFRLHLSKHSVFVRGFFLYWIAVGESGFQFCLHRRTAKPTDSSASRLGDASRSRLRSDVIFCAAAHGRARLNVGNRVVWLAKLLRLLNRASGTKPLQKPAMLYQLEALPNHKRGEASLESSRVMVGELARWNGGPSSTAPGN